MERRKEIFKLKLTPPPRGAFYILEKPNRNNDEEMVETSIQL